MQTSRPVDDHKIDLFESIVLSFSLYIIGSMLCQMFLPINDEVLKLLSFFDVISCSIFIFDWVRRIKMSHHRINFLKYNFIDILSSLPLIYILEKIGFTQFMPTIEVIAFIKIAGGVNRLIYYYKNNDVYWLKLGFSMLFLTIMIASPVIILDVEEGVGNIKTAEQALWWSYCTLSTIGYGDFFPVTTIGRIVAIVVSVGGISMFGLVSGLIIQQFMSNHNNANEK